MRFSAEAGARSAGRKNVPATTSSQTSDPPKPDSVERSAPSRLTARQPLTQPSVAIARIGPNSFRASSSRAKMIVEVMLQVGDEQRQYNWINASTTGAPAPAWMA